MSSRSPIQLDNEIKTNLEAFRDRQRLKTHSDAVERLLERVQQADKYKSEVEYDREAEKQRKAAEDIYAGEELKQRFKQLGNELGIRSDAGLLAVLIDHFDGSLQVPRTTLDLIIKHR
jgi:hypothetical protein